ncbi:MAG: hypothetical protein BGO47_14280 [Microbacterium sp. 67-17]|jgi:hypothetical protein|uniref:hypothetical protein n=1 Tax=Microbacterium sp. 67-17 TaxID=1895782 RepID=UPI000968AFD8|nr:hypothetical protein [Microbacterium sp. 67-17]OJV98931.1 MAG: hypothetical protein BGO47_14280 [Microbacterium sp. 67-17]
MVDALITPEDALAALGRPFLQHFRSAIDETRNDFAHFFATLPSDWHVDWSDRTLAGVIHDRLWSHVTHDVEALEANIVVTDNGTTRTICIDDSVGLRVKRHSMDGQISGYRTRGSRDFYMGTLAGLEVENLAIGYEWIPETRSIGRAVLSKQKSTGAEPIWVIGVGEIDDGILHVPYEPIIPPQPEFDFSGIVAASAKDAESS